MENSLKSVGLFVQARIGSRRLPEKVCLPLGGATVFAIVLRALRAIPADYYIALTDKHSMSRLESIAESEGFDCMEGADNDLLSRYRDAIRATGAKTVIRATADNPLVSVSLACAALEQAGREEPDYFGYVGAPTGACVEIINAASLLAIEARYTTRYDREHVTPYILRRPKDYRISRPFAPREYRYPGLRITLDTKADYQFLKRIFDNFGYDRRLEIPEIAAWLGLRPVGPNEKR